MTPAERVLDELDSSQRGLSAKRLRLWLVSAAILVFYAVSWNLAGIDLQKLGTGDDDDQHWDALMRFIKLGGTQEEIRAAFDKSIARTHGRRSRCRSRRLPWLSDMS